MAINSGDTWETIRGKINALADVTQSPTDNTPGRVLKVGDSAILLSEMSEIEAEIAGTAVDVFVYDTSKDSDGGAWRHRCAGTSWFNEPLNTATRGSRREFPAVAVIVAEATKVTIYDGDDPALPMWMVFNQTTSPSAGFDWFRSGRNVSCITALNGNVAFGTNTVANNGLHEANFISDNLRRVSVSFAAEAGTGKSVLNRNASTDLPTRISIALVSQAVYDVAMTVLPDAPIAPATGLPVPTIAVATDGGVSVIRDDGTVVSGGELNSGWTVTGLFFDEDATLWATEGTAYSGLQRMSVPPFSSVTSIGDPINGGYGYPYYNPVTANTHGTPQNAPKLRQGGVLYGKAMSAFGNTLVAGNTAGISKVLHNSASQLTSLVNFTTSTYNTGWMNGDIKGAFLSSTDTASLVGGDIAVNGTFDTDTVWNKQAGWTISGGVASVNSSVAGSTLIRQGTTVAGEQYRVTFDVTSHTSGQLKAAAGTDSSVEYASGVGSYSFNVVANGSGGVGICAVGSGVVASVDNVTIEKLDPDRSVNNKGLIVNGTVTKTAVATGADLVAYSGFSTANYLEQPYNSALDFGTGDFCVMGWVKGNDTYCGLVDRGTGTAGFGGSFAVGGNVTPKLFAKVGASTGYSSADVWSNTWRFVSLVRTGGVAYLYVDGAASGSFAAADSVTNASAITRIGLRTDGAAEFDGGGSLALWRISATAPTADQIRRIYEDERKLFQPGAQCTLYGTSDAVTALAHDPKTNLLHVGTSAGRSTFDGLQRVANTETPVGTAISAVNGLIVEQ